MTARRFFLSFVSVSQTRYKASRESFKSGNFANISKIISSGRESDSKTTAMRSAKRRKHFVASGCVHCLRTSSKFSITSPVFSGVSVSGRRLKKSFDKFSLFSRINFSKCSEKLHKVPSSKSWSILNGLFAAPSFDSHFWQVRNLSGVQSTTSRP